MYDEAYYKNVSRETKKRIWLGMVLLAVMIGAAAVGMALRIFWLATGVPSVMACVLFTVFQLKILPWIRYHKYMENLKTGRRRETECYFVDIAQETRMVDGVEIHDVNASLDPEGEDTRLYYWDNDFPMPDWKKGEKLRIESFGNFITQYTPSGV